MDKITLRRMPFELPIGKDAWGREKAQPVLISVEVQYDVSQAAVADDVSKTLDYGKAYKSLKKKLETFPASIGELILDVVGSLEPAEISLLEIILPKGNLRADGGLHFFLEAVDPGSLDLKHYKQSLNVRGIRCACIIGVNPHEREEEQIVVVNLDFKGDMALANGIDLHNALKASNSLFSIPYADVVRKVVKQVERSTFQTVEALATSVARTVTVDFDIYGVWVEVEKPNAIASIEAAGVRIYREKSFFTQSNFWQIKRP